MYNNLILELIIVGILCTLTHLVLTIIRLNLSIKPMKYITDAFLILNLLALLSFSFIWTGFILKGGVV